jgi:Fe-S-cluster containining protein
MIDTAETPSSRPRDAAFGYVCRRCLKCCHHKNIQLNPYEVARLARNLGLTTSEFRAAWTDDSAGLVLRQTESGACVFLGNEGCTVHPDRPLVCRLYPLGRHIRADGGETFFPLEPHPDSRGTFTGTGTIAEFLISQDAHAFIETSDDYFRWLCAARTYVHESGESEVFSATDVEVATDLLDVDTMIARHCATAGVEAPSELAARKALHLAILYQQLDRKRQPGTGMALSVLIAAICLLGISLGISATPRGGPATPVAEG